MNAGSLRGNREWLVALLLAWFAAASCGSGGSSWGPCVGPDPKAAYGTWYWDGSAWVRQSQKTVPGPLVYDAGTKQVLAYDSSPQDIQGLWEFSRAGWTFVSRPPSTPMPDVSGGVDAYIAYDSANENLMLFQCASKSSCQTWTWRGATWRLHPSVVDPGYLSGASVAYDEVRKEVVLFGGSDYVQGQSQATWTWDGTTWTLQHPDNSPPSRTGAGMAFDRAHAQMVLYGGSTNQFPTRPLSDTWTWDGKTWAQQHPSASPPAQSQVSLLPAGTAMTYDNVSGQVVAVVDVGSTTQTWTWDGQLWSEQVQTVNPPGGGQATYDSENREVVLAAGYPGCVYMNLP